MRVCTPQRKASPSVVLSRNAPSRPFGITRGARDQELGVSAKSEKRKANIMRTCKHIKANGEFCGSPALPRMPRIDIFRRAAYSKLALLCAVLPSRNIQSPCSHCVSAYVF